jgi:hypothetical protein
MSSANVVDNLFASYKSRNTFMEEYYSNKFGKPVKIVLNTNAITSSYSHVSGQIHISRQNLLDFYRENNQLFSTLFYTLIEHELGHAIYTQNLPYSESSNILEDNRIEYHISRENHRVNFNAANYIYQDAKLRELFHRVLGNNGYDSQREQILKLMLLRTVDRKFFVEKLCTSQRRTDIVNEILLLNKRYRVKPYAISNVLSKECDELKAMSVELDGLINLWFERDEPSEEVENNTQQDDNSNTPSDDSGNTPSDDKGEHEQDDDNDTPSDDKDNEQPQDDDNQDGSSQQRNENIDDVDMDDVLASVEEMKDMSAAVNDAIKKATPQLIPDFKDTTDYIHHNISIYETKRHSGIKGLGTDHKSMGNAKQLDMKRYARQGFFKDEKLFKKHTPESKGGKSAKVIFYLDISTSMRKLVTDKTYSGMYVSRLEYVIDYLKSFYDKMNKYVDISIYGFGEKTYKLNRDSLNSAYLHQNLEPDTRINIVDENADLIVVLTDGAIMNIDSPYQRSQGNYHTKFSKKFLAISQFIIVNVDKNESLYDDYYSEIPNKTIVNIENVVEGFEEATKKIKGKL